MHFFDIVQKEHVKKPDGNSSTLDNAEGPELVSLSLGTSSSTRNCRKEEEANTYSKGKENEMMKEEGLALGLHCKVDGSSGGKSEALPYSSPDNGFEERKEADTGGGEPWPPSKTTKSLANGEDEVLPQLPLKRARVSVRARCDAPTVRTYIPYVVLNVAIGLAYACMQVWYICMYVCSVCKLFAHYIYIIMLECS